MTERERFIDEDYNPSDALEALGKDKTYEILDLLTEKPCSAPELDETIGDFHGATIYRRLGELEELDLVQKRSDKTFLDKNSEATKYSASEKGEEVIKFFENLY